MWVQGWGEREVGQAKRWRFRLREIGGIERSVGMVQAFWADGGGAEAASPVALDPMSTFADAEDGEWDVLNLKSSQQL